MLAEAGCDMAAKGNTGRTGLILAAGSGSAATVRAVLEVGGSELEAKERENGATAFLVACSEGNAEVLSMLAEAGCDTFAESGAAMDAFQIDTATMAIGTGTMVTRRQSLRPLIAALQRKQRLRGALTSAHVLASGLSSSAEFSTCTT